MRSLKMLNSPYSTHTDFVKSEIWKLKYEINQRQRAIKFKNVWNSRISEPKEKRVLISVRKIERYGLSLSF